MQTLGRSEVAGGFRVQHTSSEARLTSYDTTRAVDSTELRTITRPGFNDSVQQRKPDASLIDTAPDGTVTTRVRTPDPRYGMLAPLESTVVATPAGLTRTREVTRTVTLAAAGDPLSMTSEQTLIKDDCSASAACIPLLQRTSTFEKPLMRYTDVSPAKRTRWRWLDAQERTIETGVDGIGANVETTYDAEGRVWTVAQGTRTITYGYNPTSGYLTSVTDPTGRVVQISPDSLGRTDALTLPGGRNVIYNLDAHGNPTQTTPPGQPLHGQTFEGRDLLASYTPPTIVGVNASYGYGYNGDRQLVSSTTPSGSLTYAYHPIQGLLASVIGDATKSFTHDTAGRRATADRGTEKITWGYDGALVTSEQHTGSIPVTLAHGYNHRHLRSSSNVAGSVATLGYDDDDLLTSVSGLGASVTLKRAVEVSPGVVRGTTNGRVEGVTVGSVVEARAFDPTYGELSGIAANDGSGSLLDVSYLSDALGRILTKTESVLGTPSVTTTYTYDAAGRLETETIGSAPATTWLYDLNGTRQAADVDVQDRISAYDGVQYTYTGAGERDTKTEGGDVTTYDWDRFGNLLSVQRPAPASAVEYVYDALDRRIGRKLGGALVASWLYDGQLRIVAELDGAGVVTKRFVYASRSNVPDTMVAGGVTYRLVTDHLGSVRLVVNVTNGNVAQRIDYNVWGLATADTNPGFQPFGFAGGLYDVDTQLVHFGARDYDPRLGAWTSKDAARFGGGWNFYEYANSDPVNLIDRTGRTPEGAAIGGMFGAILDGPYNPGGFFSQAGEKAGDALSDLFGGGGGGRRPGGGAGGSPYRDPGEVGPKFPGIENCAHFDINTGTRCCEHECRYTLPDRLPPGMCPNNSEAGEDCFNACLDQLLP